MGGQTTGSAIWVMLSGIVQKLCEIVRWMVWHVNHWLWLMETLHNGTVSNAEWGKLEGYGAHDSSTQSVHTQSESLEPPAYRFAGPDLHGMRWDQVTSLLSSIEGTNMVEVGVFAGHFSNFILGRFPKLQLVGIDPYIGSDNTFPGTFSQTLDPADAWAHANDIFQKHGPRAQLLQATSKDVAPAIEDGTLDGVFIDGCHYYECVEEDLRMWVPKVRKGGFIAGHDFSPQWPGVVRAVQEFRKNGQAVWLGMDWMYWWWVD